MADQRPVRRTPPAIRFQFQLRPLDQVHPWGRDKLTLHWFGLTEGWYWLDLNGHQLLRYSAETVRRRQADGHDDPPYADYYVARLWEDLLQLLPTILEPVPADLLPFIESDATPWTTRDDESDADTTAEVWYGDHYLDFGYLRNGPKVRCWRTISADDMVTIDWWYQRLDPDDDIVFAGPVRGRTAFRTQQLTDAVRDLDRQLMAAMDKRVSELERRGSPPGVELDLVALRNEHRQRTTWLAHALDRTPATGWAATRAGAARLQNRPT